MKERKLLLFLFFLGIIPVIVLSQKVNYSSPAYITKWVLVKGSSLKVDGSTNINEFTCEIADYSSPDTITVYNYLPNNSFYPLKGSLHLDVSSFNCHNSMMTNDLCKTLKAKEFPKMIIQFISLNKFPDFKSNSDIITGWVNIELAGMSKYFFVTYSFYKDAANTIHLIGKRPVNFSDFKLTPPRKLGGMIKTKETLQVEFHLTMKAIN